jgi:hypothetical protein
MGRRWHQSFPDVSGNNIFPEQISFSVQVQSIQAVFPVQFVVFRFKRIEKIDIGQRIFPGYFLQTFIYQDDIGIFPVDLDSIIRWKNTLDIDFGPG